jgi:predicted nucleotidyltransferase
MGFEKLKKKWEDDRLKREAEAEERKLILRTRCKMVFKKYRILKAVVFGSVANSRCRPESDIDLYVYPLTSGAFWDFRHDLEEAAGYTIDLYTDSDDDTFIKKILSRGEAIYEI